MGKAAVRGCRYPRNKAFPAWGRLRNENTAFLDTTPFPNGEGKEAAASPQKGSQPRLAALGSPFQGKGLAWTLPPSYGRRCPEGAEVGWGYRYPRHKAFPAWGRQRGSGFAAKKGNQPRLAALGSPFQGKGLAWTLPPSIGRRCPEGAEVGWGYRYPRHKAFPAWGRWRAERAG